jgi:hypothetical protein
VATQEIFEEGISFAFDNTITRSLSDIGISKIIVKHNAGSLSGGSSGSLKANSALESLKLKVDNQPLIEWAGLQRDNDLNLGIACMRELYKQLHKVYPVDEYYPIDLPDLIPPNHKVDLVIKTAVDIDSIQGGDRTDYDNATLDLLYEAVDALPGSERVPYISWTNWSYAARTGNIFEFLDPFPYPLRALILATHDGGTLANDTYDTLEVRKPKNPIFSGNIQDLRAQQQEKSQIALGTGFFMMTFPEGLLVPANTVQFKFNAGTAGTDKNVHVVMIGW